MRGERETVNPEEFEKPVYCDCQYYRLSVTKCDITIERMFLGTDGIKTKIEIFNAFT